MADAQGKPVETTTQLVTVHLSSTQPFTVVALDSDVGHLGLRWDGAPENNVITCREDSEINPTEGFVDLDISSTGLAADGPALDKIVPSLHLGRTYSYVDGHAGPSVRNMNDGPKPRITIHQKIPPFERN
jgi:hypothetical protein